MGYVEGRNIIYDIRAAEGDLNRLAVLARELVASQPDVLIGAATVSAEALGAITRDIPIVMTVMLDPIETGFSDSMSRPSRNLTGFTSSSPTLAAKRLELLHELLPNLRKVAYFGASSSARFTIFEQHLRSAAERFRIAVIPVPVTTEASLAGAFETVDREKVQAVLVGVNASGLRLSVQIIDQCLVRDLPSILPWSFAAQAGALMSYGPPAVENPAGAARYVDRILKGAKISELPFEEPTEIKLAINLRTARSMKITVPQTLLARADEIFD